MAERMSPRKLFAVCAAIAIIVFAIIYMLLSSLLESPAGAQQASVTAVVEAAQDIPANTVITDDMVKTVNINPEAMPKGAFTDVRAAMICTHYPGHINLNIKLNAWMLSYILRETSISFFPESVRYYNSRYISLRPVKIHQRKQSHLRSHNTSHSSFVQKSFP